MRFAASIVAVFGCLCATAMPIGVRTAVLGVDTAGVGLLLDEEYCSVSDGTFSLDILDAVESESTPRLIVKGLPTGLKFDAKAGTISGKATKPGKYTVTVSATNATVKKPVTKTFEIVVPNLKSEALPKLEQGAEAYGKIVCGVAFDPGLVDCAPEDGWTLKAAGLPAGLKLVQDKNTKAYSITGIPTKAGTFTVTFTASKRGEKNQTATITLNVEAAPDWAIGTFSGSVTGTGNGEWGTASMTVTANGKVSGKVALGGTNWTFKADSFSRAEVDLLSEVGSPKSFIINAVATAGKAKRAMELRVEGSGAVARDAQPYLVNSKADGGSDDGEWSLVMWRNVWKDKATATTAKAEIAKWEGLYTLSLDPGADYGSGYLSLAIGKDGNVKATGKLADGTSASATSPLMYDADDGWFVYVYTAPSAYKGGSFAIAVGFDGPAGRVALPWGPAQWTSRNPQATGVYGEGFSRTPGFSGAYYGKKPDVSAWSAAEFAAEPPASYGFDGVAPKVTVAQATGVFKGACSFLPDGGARAKKANFEGIVVLGAEALGGFYLWEETGTYEDPKTHREKTYKYKGSHPVSLTAK